MQITDVRIQLNENSESRKKATASVTFDNEFVVHDIKVIQGSESTFIAFPSRKIVVEEKFVDICHPICQSARDKIESAILEKYKNVLNSSEK